MRKQNRLFCDHCGEYLSRVAFWKHRRLYCDVHSERWTTKNDLDHFEHEAKRSKPDPEFRDEANTNEWPSDSSGNEDLKEFISNQGMYELITVACCLVLSLCGRLHQGRFVFKTTLVYLS